jgi:hypothetical protein
VARHIQNLKPWPKGVSGNPGGRAKTLFIQRYENLVLHAPSVLARLAAWLSIDDCPAMLNVPITNSSYLRFQQSAGFAKAFICRWRTNLSRHEIAVIQTSCGRVMREVGYQLEPVGTPLRPLLWECLKLLPKSGFPVSSMIVTP